MHVNLNLIIDIKPEIYSFINVSERMGDLFSIKQDLFIPVATILLHSFTSKLSTQLVFKSLPKKI